MSTEIPIENAHGDEPIERGETGVRALITLLFVLVIQVVEAVFAVIIVFDLAFALITRREPSDGVRRFAERVVDYTVEILRYATYNDDEPPFPFREFPAAADAD